MQFKLRTLHRDDLQLSGICTSQGGIPHIGVPHWEARRIHIQARYWPSWPYVHTHTHHRWRSLSCIMSPEAWAEHQSTYQNVTNTALEEIWAEISMKGSGQWWPNIYQVEVILKKRFRHLLVIRAEELRRNFQAGCKLYVANATLPPHILLIHPGKIWYYPSHPDYVQTVWNNSKVEASCSCKSHLAKRSHIPKICSPLQVFFTKRNIVMSGAQWTLQLKLSFY